MRVHHDGEEVAMTGNKVFVAIAMTAALGVLASATWAAMEEGEKADRGASVIPCSLVGVNPAYHPEIFGDAAVARSYGFIQGPNRVWHVDINCTAGRSDSSLAAAPARSGA
jgi:hypothetical protein